MDFVSKELNEFRESKGLLIDVRSPDEYYKGHMPDSINIPLFNNEERSYVGTKYKNSGRRKAVLTGLEIIEKKIDNIIYKFISAEKEFSLKTKDNLEISKEIKIYCARGGMRSQSISWLLEKFHYPNIVLRGGYKSYRKWVLDSFINKMNIVIIGGKTGTGKTKILNDLKKLNYQIIDLESLANHRGSSFGALGMGKQPTNEQFENLIAEELKGFSKTQNTFIESESANIGKCRIPFEFFNQMKNSPRIEIVRDEKSRLDELIKTYSIFSQEALKESVIRIQKRLGPQRTRHAIDAIGKKNWVGVCKPLLEYYDKCYEYELSKRENVYTVNLENKKNNEMLKEFIKNIPKV